jgi:hypothetical protein
MTTHPKRPAATSHKATQPKPFIRFYHAQHLRTKTLAALEAIESADDASEHAAALAEIVVELINSAMDYFFIRPLKLAKVNFLVQQSASLGIAATQQVVGTVARNVIGRMDTPQLVSVCGSIRRFMQ